MLETKVEMKNRAEVCKAAAFELIENNKVTISFISSESKNASN